MRCLGSLLRFFGPLVRGLALLFALALFLPSAHAQQGGYWEKVWTVDNQPFSFNACEGDTSARASVSEEIFQDKHKDTKNGTLTLTLVWHPKNNDATLDPAPPSMVVYYKCHAWADTSAEASLFPIAKTRRVGIEQPRPSTTKQHADAQVTATIEGVSATASASADLATPPIGDSFDAQSDDKDGDWKRLTMRVSNGVATHDFSFTITTQANATVSTNMPWADADADAADPYRVLNSHAHGGISVTAEPAGLDLGQHNGQDGTGLDGNSNTTATDPTFTRWLPLAFSPSISSQPFQNAAGYLPRPWGNINCAYSMGIYVDTASSYRGAGNWYLPPAIGAPIVDGNTSGTEGVYVFIDANGNRIPLTPALQPTAPTAAVFSRDAAGITISHAGPPGHVAERGRYTYHFAPPPPLPPPSPKSKHYPPPPPVDAPPHAHLLWIGDDFGNRQTLTYGGGGNPAAPAITVTDLTSSRCLLFYQSGEYINKVVAPTLFGTTPVVTTVLAPDNQGLNQSITVHNGDENGPVARQESYTYHNNSPATVTQGGITRTNEFANSVMVDAFNRWTPRIKSVTVGAGTPDEATFHYNYGASLLGYGFYGIDSRTNTFTDALGNATVTRFYYAHQGAPGQSSDNGAISRIITTGPTFAGATGDNVTEQRWAPDITKPEYATTIDALGGYWFTHFDAVTGMPLETYDPLNHVQTLVWNDTNLTFYTDPTGLLWQFGYGAGGRLTQVTDPAGLVQMTATYNPFGQVDTVTVPATTSASGQNVTVQHQYDPTTGDLQQVTGPTGSRWVAGEYDTTLHQLLADTAYDALGDLRAFTVFPDTGDPQTSTHGLTTRIVYNPTQLPVRIIAPDNVAQVTVLGNNSELKGFRMEDPWGGVLAAMGFHADSRGRTRDAYDLLGPLNAVRYDLNSNVTALADGLGNTTTVTYGSNREPTSLTWAGGSSSSLLYDTAGRIRQTTDEGGARRDFVYDAAHRLQSVTLVGSPFGAFPGTPDGGPPGGSPGGASSQTINFSWDDAGRLLDIADSSGNVHYTRDPATRRVTQVDTTVAGYAYSVLYTYYADGQIRTITTPAGATTFTYDVQGRVSRVVNSLNEQTTWQRDAIGRTLGQHTTLAGADIATDFAYGPTGQGSDPSTAPLYLRQVTNRVGSRVLGDWTLTHSFLGQLKERQSTPQVSGHEDDTFTYDVRGRATGSVLSYQPNAAATSTSQTATYSYDLANNLLGGVAGAWTYNSDNQLTSAPPAPASGLRGAANLSYDAVGHVVHQGDWSLTWDDWGRLDHLTHDTTGQVVAYEYDAAGRRSARRLDGALVTRYLYSGAALVAEADGQGVITRSYTWGPGGLISDHDFGTGVSRAFLYDETSHLRSLVDSTGSVVWQGAWTPWGDTAGGLVAPPTPFAWGGRWGGYTDADTGFVQLGARLYSPATGQFMSRDPSGFGAGPNLYAYCGGDPVNFFDANGCWPTSEEVATAEQNAANFLRPVANFEKGVGRTIGTAIGGPVGGLLGGGGGAASMYVGLVDAYGNCGTQQGLADGGKNNAGALWMARLDVAVQTGAAGMLIGGAVAGRLGGAASEEALALCEGGQCFIAGTPVQVVPQTALASTGGSGVATRTVPIEQVKVGDRVVSRNDKTGTTTLRRVTQTFVRTSAHLLTVTLADKQTGKVVETLQTTRQHPFFVAGKGWVPAGGLAIGNAIVTRAGPALVVKSVVWARRAEGYRVYNFQVEGDHTYFVGKVQGGVWVHNADYDLTKLSMDEVKKIVYTVPDGVTRDILSDFFGVVRSTGVDPPNLAAGEYLTRESLEAYRELAQRLINAGGDASGVQARRIKQINDFLKGRP